MKVECMSCLKTRFNDIPENKMHEEVLEYMSKINCKKKDKLVQINFSKMIKTPYLTKFRQK